jgi:hypothetical protein
VESGVEFICAEFSDSRFADHRRWVKGERKYADLETARPVVLARVGMAMDNESVMDWRKELRGGCFPRGLGKNEGNRMEILWNSIKYCSILLFRDFLGNFYWSKNG